jgi:hypothetical protein
MSPISIARARRTHRVIADMVAIEEETAADVADVRAEVEVEGAAGVVMAAEAAAVDAMAADTAAEAGTENRCLTLDLRL